MRAGVDDDGETSKSELAAATKSEDIRGRVWSLLLEKGFPQLYEELQLFHTNFELNCIHTFPSASPRDKLSCVSIRLIGSF